MTNSAKTLRASSTAIFTLLIACVSVSRAADSAHPAAVTASPATAPPVAAPASAPPAATATSPAAPAKPDSLLAPVAMTPQQVIEILDQTIDWYRTLGVQQSNANEPSDQLILYDNRQTANRVLTLAFEIARANADTLAKAPSAPTPETDTNPATQTQTLTQLQAKFTTQATAVQAELDQNQQLLLKAKTKQSVALKAKISELQGELDLITARKNFIGTMVGISSEADTGSSNPKALKAQIDAMAVILPAENGNSASAAPGTPAPAARTAAPPTALLPAVGAASRFGIWDLAADVFRLSQKISTINSVDVRTDQLAKAFAQASAPLIDQLKAMAARGDALATQADTADPATLSQTRSELDSLAGQYKAAAATLVPLGKEAVLLKQYRRNLSNWRDIVKADYHSALKSLGVRLVIILALLTIAFAAAEVLRRAVVRYVHDPRRRYQLLLLRRIGLWALIVVIVGFAFASELGSIITFAGLITAGLAVAMQSVLVSIVGYFFLIGKYGIRIGDRVQIGTVTGEVIDLGLVRLYLMELENQGLLLEPTGRVVAFANSIVFQVSSGLFRQIPGVDLSWREVTLKLPSGIDYTAAKEKLVSAVNDALKDSRDEILRQTREIQRTAASNLGGDAQPRVRLIFSATGVEAHIRYPVHSNNGAELDERVSEELSGVVISLTPPATPSPNSSSQA